MKIFDISLYGNLILDMVYYVSLFKINSSNEVLGQYESIGAMGNVARELIGLDNNLSININGTVADDIYGKKIINDIEKLNVYNSIKTTISGITSYATIISDISSNKRTSMVNWGACTQGTFEVAPSKWHHIMYLDTLINITEDDLINMSKSGTVSVDLCLDQYSSERKWWIVNRLLKHVDYLIISEVEAKSLMSVFNENNIWRSYCDEIAAEYLGKKVRKQCIIHTPHGSIMSNGEATTNYNINFYNGKKMNVLGAGDMFASYFIYSVLKNHNLDKSINFAHELTTKKIINRGVKNEKI